MLFGFVQSHFFLNISGLVTRPLEQIRSTSGVPTGKYLRIHPATLESLARSGAEASAMRARKLIADASPITINEEPAAYSNEGILGMYLHIIRGYGLRWGRFRMYPIHALILRNILNDV